MVEACAPEAKAAPVLLVDPDEASATEAAALLAPFGWRVETRADSLDLAASVSSLRPSHLLLRLHAGRDNADLVRAVAQAARTSEPRTPLIFIADDASIDARIAAVRAGAAAYLTPPLNALALIDRMEGLSGPGQAEPYRILIVDDDVVISKYYQAVLEQAGMTVLAVSEPMAVLGHLADFRPELILMDHYMPEVQGRELAAVIRQEPAFDSIPIVFLSAEDDAAAQQRVIGVGADDFLNKAIRSEHLVSAVKTRARRFRALRATMLRDSLTGLLNHTATKEHLAGDAARMQRLGKPLALCLLDLDRFKQVNDVHGHPAGDRVLRALAHLLRQRLRVSDVIGRYGGEEFAIALPDTDVESAARVLEEIREAFAVLPQASEAGPFTATFSAGLAGLPRAGDVSRLTEAADRALYAAKAAGRNRVAIADDAAYGDAPAGTAALAG
ncbi:MAG: diguanylate cyclase [Marivibrio sp.]|uniref:diguanylate cyclase n=1 Tax=Marivibrio sp. TaxID=2039719 RepID=UPI0032ED6D9B